MIQRKKKEPETNLRFLVVDGKELESQRNNDASNKNDIPVYLLCIFASEIGVVQNLCSFFQLLLAQLRVNVHRR